jgi:hypothetical protein
MVRYIIFIASRIFIASLSNEPKENWIYQKNYEDASIPNLYVTSFYFTVTTVLTVGYGDICAFSLGEKVFCILLMVVGVISFSFSTGAISSIISSYDSKEA